MNKDFTGAIKVKEINNYKVAKYLLEHGFKFREIAETLEAAEEWLDENDYAYTNSCWFEDMLYDTHGYKNLFEIIAKELGLNFVSIYSVYIGDYDGVCVDSGPTTSIQCEDEMQLEYIEWWCDNFLIEYEVDGYEVLLKDFSEENEMSFNFLYDENGKVIDSCAIDWAAGYENVSTSIASELANRDVNNIFSAYGKSGDVTKLIDKMEDMISQTSEVVF